MTLDDAAGFGEFREVYRNQYACRLPSILSAEAVYPWGCIGAFAGVFFVAALVAPVLALVRDGTLASLPWLGWLGVVALAGIFTASNLHPLWRLIRVYLYVQGGGQLCMVEGEPRFDWDPESPDMQVADQKFDLLECSNRGRELQPLWQKKGVLRVWYIPAQGPTLRSSPWYRPFDLFVDTHILVRAEWMALRPEGDRRA